jgi:ABC-type transport system substrate-binding protein
VRTAPAAKPITRVEDTYVPPRQQPGAYESRYSYTGPRPTTYQEAPRHTQMVKDGLISPLDERLPEEEYILVMDVVDEIGVYGGTWRTSYDRTWYQSVNARADCVYEDNNGYEYREWICSDWSISDDGRQYSFDIRIGAKWSDGSPLDMEAFRFAWEDVLYGESVPGAHPELFRGWRPTSYLDPVTGVPGQFAIEDDDTWTITFDTPHYRFVDFAAWTRSAWCSWGCWYAPPYLKQYHPKYADTDDLQKLVDDGGYDNWTDMFSLRSNPRDKFQDQLPWAGESHTTAGGGPNSTFTHAEANAYFFAVDPMGNQLPYYEKFEITNHKSHEVSVFRAMAGEQDCCNYRFRILELPMYMSNMEKGDYSLYNWPQQGNYGGIGFNVTFNDDPEIGYWQRTKAFRTALSYIIDREAINQVNFLGMGTLRQGVAPVGVAMDPGPEVANSFLEYDPAKAAAMLDAAGLVDTDGDGFRNRIGILGGGTGNLELYAEVDGNDPRTPQAVTLIQEGLAEVGIKFDWKQNNTYYEAIRGNTAYLTVPGGFGISQPFRSIPKSSHAHPLIANYVGSGGEGGQAPTGSDPNILPLSVAGTWPQDTDGVLMKLWEMSKEGQQFKSTHPEAVRIGKEMQGIAVAQQYGHGSICCSPAGGWGIVLKRNNFLNVPKQAISYWGGYVHHTGWLQTQYFFEDGMDNKSNPGNRSKRYKSESFLTGLTY